jgi:HEAT repeat protein
MLTRSCLKLLSAVLLSFVPVLGTAGVARSEIVVTQQQSRQQIEKIDVLIQQLKTGCAKERRSASQALEELGQPAILALVPLLKDSDKTVRVLAEIVLSRMGQPAMPLLIPLLKDPEAEVRSSAIYLLGLMEEEAKSAMPLLIPLLQDPDKEVRSHVAQVLEKLGYKP